MKTVELKAVYDDPVFFWLRESLLYLWVKEVCLGKGEPEYALCDANGTIKHRVTADMFFLSKGDAFDAKVEEIKREIDL